MHQLHLAARHQAVVVNENLRTQRENSMDITSLIIQLVSGAVGGNIDWRVCAGALDNNAGVSPRVAGAIPNPKWWLRGPTPKFITIYCKRA